MALPSFIVLGAVKAGTTSLYNYLGQHPAIEMSSWNWPRYFHVADGRPDFPALAARHGNELRAESEARFEMMCPPRVPRSLSEYSRLWPDCAEDAVRGEVSPTYMHDPAVCGRIAKPLPGAKLLLVLRDPVERAYSHFVMDRRRGWEDVRNFDDAIASEPAEANCFWWGRRHYIRHGMYADSVQRYFDLFPREQVHIAFYEDLVRDTGAYLQKILEFIGVDPGFEIDTSVRHNKGLVKRDTRMARWLRKDFPGRKLLRRSVSDSLRTVIRGKMENANYELPSPMSPDTRSTLARVFREDVLRLESLLNRDLSAWLS